MSANDAISISLPETTWQGILGVLSKEPYREVAQLLVEMDRQIHAAKESPTRESIK